MSELYRRAQLAARAAEGSLSREGVLRVSRALRDYGDDLTRVLMTLPPGTQELVEKQILLLRRYEQKLLRSIRGGISAGRNVGFRQIRDMWSQGGMEAARVGGVPEGLWGAIRRPPLTMLGAFEGRGAAHWKTLASGYVGAGAAEVDLIVQRALLEGVSPEVLARRLRPYVQGAAPLEKAFGGLGFDPRRLTTPELRGAARRMRFNSSRIAISQIHEARAEAEVQHFLLDPLIDGVLWQLAPDRGPTARPDECDVLASNDFYNMGVGVYPVDSVPMTPHPHDRCERVPKVRPVSEAGKPKRLGRPRKSVHGSQGGPPARLPGRLPRGQADRVRDRTERLFRLTDDTPLAEIVQLQLRQVTRGTKKVGLIKPHRRARRTAKIDPITGEKIPLKPRRKRRVKTVVPKTTESNLQRQLKKREDEIRTRDYEIASWYDDAGNELGRKAGESRSISFSKKQFESMRGTTITHNHPGPTYPPSPADMDLVMRGGIKRMRVVGTEYEYNIELVKGSAWPARTDFARYQSKMEDLVFEDIENWLTRTGLRAGVRDLNMLGQNELWARTVVKFPQLRYTRTPLAGASRYSKLETAWAKELKRRTTSRAKFRAAAARDLDEPATLRTVTRRKRKIVKRTKSPEHSPTLASKLKKQEDKIRAARIEHAGWYNDAGEMLGIEHGSMTTIRFTPRQMSTWKNATLTHNHPIVSLPHSPADLRAAITGNLKEIRVVSEEFDYVMLRPANGKWPDADAFIKAYDEANKATFNVMLDLRKGRRPGEILFSKEDAYMMANHRTWLSVTERFPEVTYRRIGKVPARLVKYEELLEARLSGRTLRTVARPIRRRRIAPRVRVDLDEALKDFTPVERLTAVELRGPRLSDRRVTNILEKLGDSTSAQDAIVAARKLVGGSAQFQKIVAKRVGRRTFLLEDTARQIIAFHRFRNAKILRGTVKKVVPKKAVPKKAAPKKAAPATEKVAKEKLDEAYTKSTFKPTEDQLDAVRGYQGHLYEEMNEFLRVQGGSFEKLLVDYKIRFRYTIDKFSDGVARVTREAKQFYKLVVDLQRAIAQAPRTLVPMITYRTVRSPKLLGLTDEMMRNLAGSIIQDKGFMSVTTSRSQALRWAVRTEGDFRRSGLKRRIVLFEIDAPAGTRGGWMNAVDPTTQSGYFVKDEFILPPGSRVIITDVIENTAADATWRWKVKARLLP